MIRRLAPIFTKHIAIFVVIVALIVISSVTKGQTAVVTSTAAGLVMIYAAISFVVYIIKTPAKKTREEVA